MTLCACLSCTLHGYGCCVTATRTATILTGAGRATVPTCVACGRWWDQQVGEHRHLLDWLNRRATRPTS